VQQSLKDLGLQQLDLVLVHWPEAWQAGSDVDGTVIPDDSVTLLDTWCVYSLHLSQTKIYFMCSTYTLGGSWQ
jgi:diketogulonate reductase-like aldo/keto reductase